MKHVLITGGSDGVGRATAQKLKAAGYKVTILSHNEAKTKAAAEEIGCAHVVADVADYTQVERALQQAEQDSGPVDVLINNAGVWLSKPLTDTEPELIKRTIDINVLGTIYPCRIVAPGMRARKSGRVINVISQAGLKATPNRTVYHASKWAITGFTKALQQELHASNVSVVGYYPGTMNTDFFAKSGDIKDRSKSLAPEAAADTLVYLCNAPDNVEVLEFGIQSLEY